jgi:hypothetical protein
MILRNKPMGATIYGIDLGKNTFHIVGVDSAGRPMQRITLSRAAIFNFFSNASKCGATIIVAGLTTKVLAGEAGAKAA